MVSTDISRFNTHSTAVALNCQAPYILREQDTINPRRDSNNLEQGISFRESSKYPDVLREFLPLTVKSTIER
jgi:hypothetical protein